MSLEFVNETDKTYDFDLYDVALKVVDKCIDYMDFPFEASVSLTLMDNDSIWELNKEYRQVDRPTDVLSFPMIEYPSAGDFSKVEEDDDNFDPDSGEALLGDIIISLEKVEEQAEEFNHSILREYAFLICHSMLHLFGFDHMTEEEETVMFAKQKEIMDLLEITRG